MQRKPLSAEERASIAEDLRWVIDCEVHGTLRPEERKDAQPRIKNRHKRRVIRKPKA